MRKELIIAIVLLAPAGFGTQSPAHAMCVDPGPPRLVEAKVIACEDPRALAEKRQSANKARMRELTADEDMVEAMLAARPAQVVKLRVLRTQRFSADPRANEQVTREPWVDAKEQEKAEKQYLVLDVKACDELQAGSTRAFLEEFTCCDVLPPQDLPCLLGLPTLTVAPESLAPSSAQP